MKKVETKIDPIECNVPNINFSLIDKTDDRWEKYKEQRLERGFDDSETWALDSTVVKFVLPRLKRYVEVASEVIVIEDDIKKDIDAVIEGFEIYIQEEGHPDSMIAICIDLGKLPNDIDIIKKRKDFYSKELMYNIDEAEFKRYDNWFKVNKALKTFAEIFHKLWW